MKPLTSEELIDIIRREVLGATPVGEITTAALIERDADGNNAIHYAARHDQLYYIPKEHLTEENLLIPDENDLTIFQYGTDTLRQLEPECITTKILTTPVIGTKTPIQLAAGDGGLAFVPITDDLCKEDYNSIMDQIRKGTKPAVNPEAPTDDDLKTAMTNRGWLTRYASQRMNLRQRTKAAATR